MKSLTLKTWSIAGGLVVVAVAVFLAARVSSSTITFSITPAVATTSIPDAPLPVPEPIPPKTQRGPLVTIGSAVVSAELAKTDSEVQKGLSGRVSLDADKGMLFLFSKPDIYRFWMPDMHFPLDMIWINSGRVIDISADVSDDFDPLHPHFYTPRTPARYVLEVNAGFAARHNIKIGDVATFSDLTL